MTDTLSQQQLIWLRGLLLSGHSWVLMSATELGDPEVSELQSTGLVRVIDMLDGKHWQITEKGEAALTTTEGR